VQPNDPALRAACVANDLMLGGAGRTGAEGKEVIGDDVFGKD
jgi:hypothetical protein